MARSPNEKEDSESVAQGINKLRIETEGTEEEAAEHLVAVLEMKVNGDG